MGGIAATVLGISVIAAAPMTSAATFTGDAPGRSPRWGTPNVCHDTKISKVLPGATAGALLAPVQDVTTDSGLSYGRLYRVLYATDGDAGSVVATCGLIAVPETASVNGVVAWAHGTIGLRQKCQPSEKPSGFVGAMPGGIGSPVKNGNQADGALVNILKDGKAVVATDYPSAGLGGSALQRYVLGVSEGLAVLNSARVFTHNAEAFGMTKIDAAAQLPLLTWGHSQGGGSALWAGQLAKQYFGLRADASLNLVGVAAEAPATQFTTSPGQPSSYLGKHLGDRDIYNFNPGLGVPLAIGSVLFSYVTASWSQVQDATSGPMPFGPTDSVKKIDVLTPSGFDTAPQVADDCLGGVDLLSIVNSTSKYLAPDLYRFFASPFGGTRSNGQWNGAIDTTCANPTKYSKSVQNWCAWLQFNMPGPNGVNNYSKVPLDNTGKQVPIYLAQGRADRIIWCVDNDGMVSGANCLSAQYVQSMNSAYCDGAGYLETDYFDGIGHLQVPGAAAMNPDTKAYDGSPLEGFITSAFRGSAVSGCPVHNRDNPT